MDSDHTNETPEPYNNRDLMQAIRENNLSLVMCCQINGYIEVNVLCNGRLPLEVACECGFMDIAEYLLEICGADFALCNAHGVNAIMQCCVNNHFEFLKDIVRENLDKFPQFLDAQEVDYIPEMDVVRIIIELDSPLLLVELLHFKDTLEEIGLIDSGAFLRMHNYAIMRGKLNIATFLQTQVNFWLALERRFMLAVMNYDFNDIEECIASRVNYNKETDGKYPLELACERSNITAALKLLAMDDVIWFNFNDIATHGYDPRLDPVKIAIENDHAALLKEILIKLHGDPAVLCFDIGLLGDFHDAAKSAAKPNVLALLNTINVTILGHIESLFNAAVSGDVAILRRVLSSKVNVSSYLNGKTIVHVLCELNHSNALRASLSFENIDVNLFDINGHYPITIACMHGYFASVEVLLESEITRLSCFNDSELDSYAANLDLIRVAIAVDDAQMLEELLKFSQENNNPLIVVNLANITLLRDYAISSDKPCCLLRLNHYVAKLQNKNKLFDLKPRSDIRILADDSQGISRVEPSFIASIKRLCRRYRVNIVMDAKNNFITLEFPQDKHALLQSLERMISQASDTQYEIYRKTEDETVLFDRLLTDAEYRTLANETLERLRGSFDPNVLCKWHSAWCETGSEVIEYNRALVFAEVWCLAILAAQDKLAINGKILTDLDIFDREQILVHTMVECARAYYYDKNFLDTGADPRQSCDHGVAIRALLNLCAMHSDIVIIQNPIEWAASVAAEEVTKLYQASPQREVLSNLLRSQLFQLSAMQKELVDQFYAEAKAQIRPRLLDELGLMTQGGYLLKQELKTALNLVSDVKLPFLEYEAEKLTNVIYSYPDYTLIRCDPIYVEDYGVMQQYKLPDNVDSAYAAILISALDRQLSVPQCTTVQQLRNEVANVLDIVLNHPDQFQVLRYTSFNRCLTSASSGTVICRVIKNRFHSLYPAYNEEDYSSYLDAVRNYAAADMLVLMIIAAIYGSSIALYDFKGSYTFELSSSILSLQNNTRHLLHLCCRTINKDGKIVQDFSLANALVTADTWSALLPGIASLQIPAVQQRLDLDQEFCCDYTVMQGRNIAGMQQIKIPSDVDNCVNAVFAAARHANIVSVMDLSGVDELKVYMQHELGILNSQHGLAENLQALAQLLCISIHVYSVATNAVNVIGDNPAYPQINLYNVLNHLNLLVAVGSWYGPEILGIGPTVRLQKLSVAPALHV